MSLNIASYIFSGGLPLEDIIELEQEALAETGNIILNSCLATIANMLQRSLRMSLPEILRGSGADFFDLPEIAMLMDLPAPASPKRLLAELIARTAEGIHEADVIS